MPKNEYKEAVDRTSSLGLPLVAELQQWLRVAVTDIYRGRLMQYLPYALYLVMLGVLYIGNGHRVDRVIRGIESTKLQVEELRADYMTAKADYMYALKRTEVVKRAKKLGLVESPKPPEVIYVEK